MKDLRRNLEIIEKLKNENKKLSRENARLREEFEVEKTRLRQELEAERARSLEFQNLFKTKAQSLYTNFLVLHTDFEQQFRSFAAEIENSDSNSISNQEEESSENLPDLRNRLASKETKCCGNNTDLRQVLSRRGHL